MKRMLGIVSLCAYLFLSGGEACPEAAHFFLRAVDLGKSRLLFQAPVQPGETISLRSIHSLTLTPYTHFYRFDQEGNLILSGAEFESAGGGYPETGDGVFSLVNGKFRMEGMNRFLGRLRFRVSPISKETLILSGREYPLHQMVPEGTPIEVSIGKERSPF